MGTQLCQLQQMKHSGFGKFLDPPIPQRITLRTQKCLSASFILTSAKNVSVKIYGITMNVQLKVVINVLLSLYKSLGFYGVSSTLFFVLYVVHSTFFFVLVGFVYFMHFHMHFDRTLIIITNRIYRYYFDFDLCGYNFNMRKYLAQRRID